MKLDAFREQYGTAIETAVLAPFERPTNRLDEAMAYALSSGGKRIRPLLTLAFAAIGVDDLARVIPAAVAVEYVHTYSLIHDDLPAMDDDDYRRGRLSVHKAFDEATAILAGDALLTFAFSYLADLDLADAQKLRLIQWLAAASGYRGMVRGQMADIQLTAATPTLEALHALDTDKTGRLLMYCVFAGLSFITSSKALESAANAFAYHYGLAYQIQNDLQSALWTPEQRGKGPNKKAETEVGNSYLALLGVDGTKQALSQELAACRQAIDAIAEAAPKCDRELLLDFVDLLVI